MNFKATKLILVASAVLLAACGGGGGGDPPVVPPAIDVTVSGRITFDRVPFKLALGTGLDFGGTIVASARGVTVEVVDSTSNAVLATTSTNSTGDYSIIVPGNRNLFVRAKSQMLAGGAGASWNFRVLNNTNGNALYALDGQPFNSGTVAVTRNLHATSGWDGAMYSVTRNAAPFAILDTVYRAKELLLTANSALAMPPLDLFWSSTNRPASPFCPATGHIVSTAYQRSVTNPCAGVTLSLAGIYVQGDFANGAGDTDEFDQSVIAHEVGHYVEDKLARNDSIGGEHHANYRLDMRVAMSEGWGNAFSAMVLNDPVYRDSIGAGDTVVDIESGPDLNAGWFSEATVAQVIWDVFDAANENGDGVALGFAPIYQALLGPHRTTLALTSLHSFIAAVKGIRPDAAGAVDTLLTVAPRSITGIGDFATGETNNGSQSLVLPIYKTLILNQTSSPVCTTAHTGVFNRLGNRQFLVLELAAPASVTITATGSSGPVGSQAANDPDFVLWRQGMRVRIADGIAVGFEQISEPLQSGIHILEVYDYVYVNPASAPSTTARCMTIAATG